MAASPGRAPVVLGFGYRLSFSTHLQSMPPPSIFPSAARPSLGPSPCLWPAILFVQRPAASPVPCYRRGALRWGPFGVCRTSFSSCCEKQVAGPPLSVFGSPADRRAARTPLLCSCAQRPVLHLVDRRAPTSARPCSPCRCSLLEFALWFNVAVPLRYCCSPTVLSLHTSSSSHGRTSPC